MQEKLNKLKQNLSEMKGAILAFSGGVDSTYLLKEAYDILGENIIAVIGKSDTFPEEELNSAIKLAKDIGANFLIIETEEMKNPEFVKNPNNRCYYCKSELFGKINQIAIEKGFQLVLDGSNADDDNDYRPGFKAARELGVRSPLKEAGLNKNEIRQLSKSAGLPTWNKPSMACLSSRISYGSPIEKDVLRKIELAEVFLRTKGFRQVRVRVHDKLARIEVERQDIPLLTATPLMTDIDNFIKNLGFIYVTVDLSGFQSGSMNKALPEELQ